MILFLYLVGFALFTAVVFTVIHEGDSKSKFLYGVKVFFQFVLISLVLGWILYFLPY